MRKIDPVEYEKATAETKQLLDEVKGVLGATPNMTTSMANSAVLEGWLGLYGALRKVEVDFPVVEPEATSVV